MDIWHWKCDLWDQRVDECMPVKPAESEQHSLDLSKYNECGEVQQESPNTAQSQNSTSTQYLVQWDDKKVLKHFEG